MQPLDTELEQYAAELYWDHMVDKRIVPRFAPLLLELAKSCRVNYKGDSSFSDYVSDTGHYTQLLNRDIQYFGEDNPHLKHLLPRVTKIEVNVDSSTMTYALTVYLYYSRKSYYFQREYTQEELDAFRI